MNEKQKENEPVPESAFFMTGGAPGKVEAKPEAGQQSAVKVEKTIDFDPRQMTVIYTGLCIICQKRKCYYVSTETMRLPILPLCGGFCAQEFKDRYARAAKMRAEAEAAVQQQIEQMKKAKEAAQRAPEEMLPTEAAPGASEIGKGPENGSGEVKVDNSTENKEGSKNDKDNM